MKSKQSKQQETMKAIRKKIHDLISKIEDKANYRDSIYDNCADAWHESDEARIYEDKTDNLREAINSLCEAADYLEGYQELTT